MVAQWQLAYSRLSSLWKAMVDENFATATSGIWRHNKYIKYLSRRQGYKIHVSATVSNSIELGGVIGEYCANNKIASKCPNSILNLRKLNSGQFGYSQVGKIFTIYLTDEEQKHLSNLKNLTRRFSGPDVPFDMKISDSNCLFYRYGSFLSKYNTANLANGMVHDDRTVPLPDGIQALEETAEGDSSPLLERSLIYQCLSQRGKGGVYRSITFLNGCATHSVLKEGRKLGEESWLGETGFDLAIKEKSCLEKISSLNISPKVIDSFETDRSIYLAIENVDGDNLLTSHARSVKSNINRSHTRTLIVQLARGIKKLHNTGVAWRDLKPQNIIQNGSVVRFIDFEGAVWGSQSNLEPWGSPSFVPPEWSRVDHRSFKSQDIYAMGKTINFLLSGRFFNKRKFDDPPQKIGNLSLSEIREIKKITRRMTSRSWNQRPNASQVEALLRCALKQRRKN